MKRVVTVFSLVINVLYIYGEKPVLLIPANSSVLCSLAATYEEADQAVLEPWLAATWPVDCA